MRNHILIHRWCQGIVPEAGKSWSLSYKKVEDRSILYSYNMPIAAKLYDRGGLIVFLHDNNLSSTTRQHIEILRGVVTGTYLQVFNNVQSNNWLAHRLDYYAHYLPLIMNKRMSIGSRCDYLCALAVHVRKIEKITRIPPLPTNLPADLPEHISRDLIIPTPDRDFYYINEGYITIQGRAGHVRKYTGLAELNEQLFLYKTST